MHRSLPIEADLSSPTKRLSSAGLMFWTGFFVIVLIVVLALEGVFSGSPAGLGRW